jgi:hypothetical protein
MGEQHLDFLPLAPGGDLLSSSSGSVREMPRAPSWIERITLRGSEPGRRRDDLGEKLAMIRMRSADRDDARARWAER